MNPFNSATYFILHINPIFINQTVRFTPKVHHWDYRHAFILQFGQTRTAFNGFLPCPRFPLRPNIFIMHFYIPNEQRTTLFHPKNDRPKKKRSSHISTYARPVFAPPWKFSVNLVGFVVYGSPFPPAPPGARNCILYVFRTTRHKPSRSGSAFNLITTEICAASAASCFFFF